MIVLEMAPMTTPRTAPVAVPAYPYSLINVAPMIAPTMANRVSSPPG